MKLSRKDFDEIAHKARCRSVKWQAFVMLGGILAVAVVTAYSMPSHILDAAYIASTSSFLGHISSWQAWLCLAPVLAYLIISVHLWERAEDQALEFWWDVLYSVKILTDDEGE